MTPPSGTRLEDLSLREGVFRAHLPGDHQAESIDLLVDGQKVAAARVSTGPQGACIMEAALPIDVLKDGFATVVFMIPETREILATYPISAGRPLSQDIRAKVETLTAELSALRRAFMADGMDHKLRAVDRPLIVAEAAEAALAALTAHLQEDAMPPEPSEDPAEDPAETPAG